MVGNAVSLRTPTDVDPRSVEASDAFPATYDSSPHALGRAHRVFLLRGRDRQRTGLLDSLTEEFDEGGAIAVVRDAAGGQDGLHDSPGSVEELSDRSDLSVLVRRFRGATR